MIAFISSTPYHTWNSITMARKMFPNEKCDLYLLDICSNYEEISKRLKEENVFEDVYPCKVAKFQCNNIKNPIIRKLKKSIYFIGWKYFLKKSASIEKQYDTVFTASNDEPCCFIMSRMKSLNSRMNAYYFEDGAGDYIYNAHAIHYGFKKRFARFLGIDYDIGDKIDTNYVLNPACVATNEYTLRSIATIDLEKDLELKSILNRVFLYKPFSIREKSVFLYSCFENAEFDGLSREIVQKIVARYGVEKLLFKDHPRLPAEGYEGIRKYPKEKETLWECISMNNDYSDKVLLSVMSTAMYVPKLLFDQEPILVFLFRVIPVRQIPSFQDEESDRTFYDFLMRLRSTYSDPSRVFIPETEEELFDYLDGVMNG